MKKKNPFIMLAIDFYIVAHEKENKRNPCLHYLAYDFVIQISLALHNNHNYSYKMLSSA